MSCTTHADASERPPQVVVTLFGKEIFRAYTSPLNPVWIVGIRMIRPETSTTPRGALPGPPGSGSTACWTSSAQLVILPDGVRVFIREDGHLLRRQG